MYVAAVFLPLLGSLIAGILVFVKAGDREGQGRIDLAAQTVTSGVLILAAVAAGFVFFESVGAGDAPAIELLNWIGSGNFEISWELRGDTLSLVMVFMVTVVSSTIHVYSIGYMAKDPGVPRFMCYLNLFTFFMLMLVTANNLVQLFFGWEGVGLMSYLLIGFWYDRPSANAAAIKAFVVNRVGDFGFALGIFAVFFLFDSVNLT